MKCLRMIAVLMLIALALAGCSGANDALTDASNSPATPSGAPMPEVTQTTSPEPSANVPDSGLLTTETPRTEATDSPLSEPQA